MFVKLYPFKTSIRSSYFCAPVSDEGGDGSGSGGGSGTSDKADEPDNGSNLEGLIKKRDELLGEVKKIKAQFRERDEQYRQMISILETSDPEALKKLKQDHENAKELETKLNQQISEAEGRLKQQYEPKIQELTQQLELKAQALTTRLQNETLQETYLKNGGEDFASFKALLNSRFKVEYQEAGTDSNGFPKYEIKSILNADGTPEYIDGKEATPDDIMLRARQGVYGKAFQSVFKEFNLSSGGGLPSGNVGANGVLRYPRAKQAQLLAGDYDGTIAAKIAKGEIEFY